MFGKKKKQEGSGSSQERRRNERLEFVQATYYREGAKERDMSECMIYNLSETGLFLKTKNTMSIDDRIVVLFNLAGKVFTEESVIVRNQQDNRYGCAFINPMSDQLRKAIDLYIQLQSGI
jgi:c-di-GMP-binding flagellar brake protein YcgR